MKGFLLVAIALAALAASASASPSSAALVSFRTPSGNIGCIYASAEPGLPANLRCDIRTGLRPKPTRPAGCDLDYGDSYALLKVGHTLVTCHGDTALDPRAPVLAYGRTWSRNGFACASRSSGLRCSNLRGHGFFMSRGHSYRF